MKNKYVGFFAMLLVSIFALTACVQSGPKEKHKKTNVAISSAQVKQHNQDGTDQLLWLYYWLGPNNTYYSYTSPTQLTSFNTVDWSTSTGSTSPVTQFQTQGYEVTQGEELSVEYADLSEAAQAEITNDPSYSEQDLSEAESASTEGYESNDLSESSSSSDSYDSGSDGGSFDGGGFDGGGGDGGGGE